MDDKGIGHRDLSPENILYKFENSGIILKISDYGTSKTVNAKLEFTTNGIGKFQYMAPEVIKKNYNIKCDLWSLGVIIYELFFQKLPFPSLNPEAHDINILQTISIGNSDLDNLVKSLLKPENKRLNWKDYFKHPFFQNFSELVRQKGKIEIISLSRIIIKLKVKERDKNENKFKDIYFLENDFYLENNDKMNYDKENKEIKELNGENADLYINNKSCKFKKFFKPKEIGDYEIKILFTKKFEDCSFMFRGCENIINIDLSCFNSSKVKNMHYMFGKCYNLKEINLNNLDTKNVTDMSYMFNKCSNLENLEFSSTFNTEKVENMSFMFHQCENLSNIKFSSSFITKNVKNMRSMFKECFSLKKIDLKNFLNENVEDMSYMFSNCTNLKEIVINSSQFIPKQVTLMSNMFNNCNNLKNIDFSSFNVENVNFSSFMFYNCYELENINLSNFKINKDANITYMFSGCKKLKKINLSSFIITNNNDINGMFNDLENIKEIKVNQKSLDIFKQKFKEPLLNFLVN